jgi:AcrR family transcriptional regulator
VVWHTPRVVTAGSSQRRTPVRPPRRGRPTAAEAAQLDEAVREAALALFLERGYEACSMEAIAKAAGTTKVSLYARFPGKAEVFRAVLTWATNRPDWPYPEPDPPPFDDLEAALTAIGRAGAKRALDPAMVQLSRIAAAQADQFPDVAQRTQRSVGRRQRVVADLLRQHAATGEIEADDPEMLAELFVGLVASAPARLAALGTVRDPADQDRYTLEAVQLFLRALRPR